MSVRLDQYHGSGVPTFTRGRTAVVEVLWILMQALFVSSFLPGSWHRRVLLRAFGARIGRGVVIKPGIRVKFPWRLTVGDHSWLGESAWIDNLAEVRIGSHAVLSQGTYLCTGNHDYTQPHFPLVTKPIVVGDQAWVCAHSIVAPGTIVGEGAVLGLGATGSGSMAPWTIYAAGSTHALGPRVVATGRVDK